MSSNLNMVLADCEKQAQQLTKEIAKYQAAGAISEQVAKSLHRLFESLAETQERNEPIKHVFSRRVLVSLGVLLVSNSVLLIAVLFFLLFK
jgi:hypothetical protein